MPHAELPISEVERRLLEIVDGVEQHHDRVVLTRDGRPVAVLISPDELESIEETLEILADPDALREIRAAEAELDAGGGMSLEEFRAKYMPS